MQLAVGTEIKSLIAFMDFHYVNSPTMADFKIQHDHLRMHFWEKMCHSASFCYYHPIMQYSKL